jgi:nitric oxide reductase subunit C
VTKRGTRLFFVVSTALSALIFLGLTIDTHRQFPALTRAADINADVVAGKHVWHRNNCINCHTLLGEGAYYAPDLTKIATQRGPEYLRAFLQDPSRFYSEERDGRLMPNPDLTEEEITGVIAFLSWVSRIDTQGWPPRPILVKGTAVPGANLGAAPPPTPASANPVELGRVLFNATPPGCAACHSIVPGVSIVGPTLAGMPAVAAARIQEPGYRGGARDAAGYVRESIVDPHAYVLAGVTYSAGGRSLMPPDYGQRLTAEQVDQLVAYLMTLQ